MPSAGVRQQAPPLPDVPWWRRLANRFWGYDFFVSYHWDSGGTYAVKLAEDLRERRFDCFLDRSEFGGGDDWRREARQALANTQRLIVVGTREALTDSPAVRDEVTMFTARSGRVIPILFGERIPDAQRPSFPTLNLIPESVVEIIERAESRSTGPSEAALDRIEHAHTVLRRRRLRALVVTVAIVVLGLAALAAFGSFLNAQMQRNVARQALIDTQRELSRSLVDRGVRDARDGDRVGLLRLRRAYEIAHRLDLAADADIPRDEAMSRTARRLLAGWQASLGLGLLHDGGVSDADLSPTGAVIRTMTVNIDGEPVGHHFWDARTGRSLGITIPVDDEYPDLVMSRDWRTAVHWTGAELRRWNLGTGEMRVLRVPASEVGDESRWRSPPPIHSADGRWGVKRGTSQLEIWNLETGRIAHTVKPTLRAPGRFRFSPDASTLIVISGGGAAVDLFDTQRGLSRGPAIEVDGRIAEVLVSRQGRSAAIVLEAGGVLVSDVESGQVSSPVGPTSPRPEVSFSPDGATLLVKSGSRAWLVASRDGTVRGEIEHEGPDALALFSPDGRALATSGSRPDDGRTRRRGALRIWDTQTARQRFELSHRGAAEALAFSSDGKLLLVATADRYEVYDARTGERRGRGPTAVRGCRDRDCRRIGFSTDGRAVYALSWQQRVVRLIQSELPELVLDHPSDTSEVALSPNASRLLTATREGRVRFWDLGAEAPVAARSEPVGRISRATFSRDGVRAVTEHGFGEFRTWEPETGRPRLFAAEDSDTAAGLRFGQQGTVLWVEEGKARLWDFASDAPGRYSLSTPLHSEVLALSSDGRLLAETNYGEDVRIRDVRSDQEVHRLNPRSGAVQDLQEPESVVALAFSADSTRLLTATTYGTVRIWEVAAGRLATELVGPAYGIETAVFSPDGEVIASLHGDEVRVWDVTTGHLLQDLSAWRAGSVEFGADGRHLFVATAEATFRWRLPHLPDQAQRIRAWVDVVSLARWSEQGSPTSIGLSAWKESWQRLDEWGGPF